MDTKVVLVTVDYQDIWECLTKWDLELAKKIIKENKKIEICQHLSQIKSLVNSILTYKVMIQINENNNDSNNCYLRVNFELCHLFYGMIMPIHESELHSNLDKRNWNAGKYWEYNDKHK